MPNPSTFMIFSFIILLIGCTEKSDKQPNPKINYKDTIYATHILEVYNGDTIKEYKKIYFFPTDQAIDTTNFYYFACNIPCNVKSIYWIYFDRAQVILFCDSMLKALPIYKNKGDDTTYWKRDIYERIKEQASNNKMKEFIMFEEIQKLMARFRPLVLNPTSGDKPKYIIVEYENVRSSEYKYYEFKTFEGDTVLLKMTVIQPTELEKIK